MRVLITGSGGFAGTHLAAYLLSLKKFEVFGLARPGSERKNISGVRELPVDILNFESVRTALKKSKPERIFHLAGQASVALSWNNPQDTFKVNVEGTRNLFEAVLAEKLKTRIHVACSAEQYGVSGNKEKRLREDSAFMPLNPYAVSKIAQEFLACQYFLSKKLPVVCTRAFNHFGPGQSEQFVASSFARQFALIELGLKKPQIEVGNLEAVRDFTDVRDVAMAYYLALEKGKPGEVYNVASGKARKVSQILYFYLKRSSVKIRVISKQARTTDLKNLVGDPKKLLKSAGWSARIPFEKTLADLLTYWKGRVVSEKR